MKIVNTFRCMVCGAVVLLAYEFIGTSCIQISDHHCHAPKPHTEISMETKAAPMVLTTAAGSTQTNINITPASGSLGFQGYEPKVTVGRNR